MLLLSQVLLLLQLAAIVRADLTCLEWALISPLIGVFCHFEPVSFGKAEDTSKKVVKEVVESAKNLVEFDLTYNPIAITYNFAQQSAEGGLAQGEQYLHNVTTDIRDVSIGFGKESANQIVQIYELAHWNDISLCLVRNAVQRTFRRSRMAKRASQISPDDGVKIARKCMAERIKSFSKPALFNVTDSNQKIGSTISDLASMLVPVGLEEGSAVSASREAADLIVPGAERETRIYKLVDGKGDHFANAKEAQATASKMRDSSWVTKNCASCHAPPLSLVARMHPLTRRWDIRALCCRAHIPQLAMVGLTTDEFLDEVAQNGYHLDSTGPPSVTDYDSDSEDEFSLLDSESSQDVAATPPIMRSQSQVTINLVTEAELAPTVSYPIHTADDVAAIQVDLDSYSTSLVQWDSELTRQLHSKDLFATLRQVFLPEEKQNPLRDLLHIRTLEATPDIPFTAMISSADWKSSSARTTNEQFKSLIEFVDTAVKQCTGIVAELKSMPESERAGLRGTVEFLYSPPQSGDIPISFDRDHMSVAHDYMNFVASDTSGLVVERREGRTMSALVPQADSFHMLKGVSWNPIAYFDEQATDGASRWVQFGHEAATKGRVEMRVVVSER